MATSPSGLQVSWQRVQDPSFGGEFGQEIRGMVRWPGGIVAWGRDMNPTGGGNGDPIVALWSSTDARHWDKTQLDVGHALRDFAPEVSGVAYGPNGFVAIGGVCCTTEERAAIFWAPDPSHWQRTTFDAPPYMDGSNENTSLFQVAAGPQGYLVIGSAEANHTAAWFSPDGRAWERIGNAPDIRGFFWDVAPTVSGFVVAGVDQGGSDWDAGVWLVSADGRSWHRSPGGSALSGPKDDDLNLIWPFKGGFLAQGARAIRAERRRCVASGGDCSVGDQTLYLSGNGIVWQTVGTPERPWPPKELTLIEYRALAPWRDGLVDVGTDSDEQVALWASPDGRSWIRSGPADQLGTHVIVNALLVDGDTIVAGGDDGSDAAIWLGTISQ